MLRPISAPKSVPLAHDTLGQEHPLRHTKGKAVKVITSELLRQNQALSPSDHDSVVQIIHSLATSAASRRVNESRISDADWFGEEEVPQLVARNPPVQA
jgi:HPt (histidine-containing phosphotransfer) domain-containing protein